MPGHNGDYILYSNYDALDHCTGVVLLAVIDDLIVEVEAPGLCQWRLFTAFFFKPCSLVIKLCHIFFDLMHRPASLV